MLSDTRWVCLLEFPTAKQLDLTGSAWDSWERIWTLQKGAIVPIECTGLGLQKTHKWATWIWYFNSHPQQWFSNTFRLSLAQVITATIQGCLYSCDAWTVRVVHILSEPKLGQGWILANKIDFAETNVPKQTCFTALDMLYQKWSTRLIFTGKTLYQLITNKLNWIYLDFMWAVVKIPFGLWVVRGLYYPMLRIFHAMEFSYLAGITNKLEIIREAIPNQQKNGMRWENSLFFHAYRYVWNEVPLDSWIEWLIR